MGYLITSIVFKMISLSLSFNRLLTILPSLGTLPVVDGGIIASNAEKGKRGGGGKTKLLIMEASVTLTLSLGHYREEHN